MIEKIFDVPFISDLALREKQIQQNYRPIIAVHKWFARRPGTLFRGLILSEFVNAPLRESFYRANNLQGITVADPFMGGGTPLIEANRVGCNVIGLDINPMSFWIVKQEIEHVDLVAYKQAASRLREELAKKIGHLYRTSCCFCKSKEAHVKYFLWVKVQKCQKCEKDIDLFPGYLLAEDRRHPKNVFVCPTCGELTETEDRINPGKCFSCHAKIPVEGPARRNRCVCPNCEEVNIFPDPSQGPPRHRMFAIEYHCPACKQGHVGRFFKKPDSNDLSSFSKAEKARQKSESKFVPNEEIPSGDETDRLHRWGYKYYCDLFNPRQLLGLELSCHRIKNEGDVRIQNALATNLSDLLRYQNMLCRYDSMALKSLDIFSIHGFPVGLVQCESNFLGIPNGGDGVNIGSGGWSNIIEKFIKAKAYCDHPFEIRHNGFKKSQVFIEGEWIGDRNNGEKRVVDLRCKNASTIDLPTGYLDAVFTDPPYFGNVQYAELMDFCYVWLRRLIGERNRSFSKPSTRNLNELTGNKKMRRGLTHFTEGLSGAFQRMGKALKPGSPFVFTYHHNDLDAYLPIAVAILDSGLTCSASLPCPGEMGASIHIHGTGSSIVDTVFVCRSTGTIQRKWITDSPEGVAALVKEDIHKLMSGNVNPTQGDIKCLVYGHLIRLAVWFLRKTWERDQSAIEKMKKVSWRLEAFGGPSGVQKHLGDKLTTAPELQLAMIRERGPAYDENGIEVSF